MLMNDSKDVSQRYKQYLENTQYLIGVVVTNATAEHKVQTASI